MGANVVNYFPDPREKLRVIQAWFADLNAVAAKLARIANASLLAQEEFEMRSGLRIAV